MSEALPLRVVAVELYERRVRLRLPFRFGVVTLTEAPQAFVRVCIRLADGREGWGAGAELLAPKWFDKNLALSNEDNFAQLPELTLDRHADGAPGGTSHEVGIEACDAAMQEVPDIDRERIDLGAGIAHSGPSLECARSPSCTVAGRMRAITSLTPPARVCLKSAKRPWACWESVGRMATDSAVTTRPSGN